MECSIKFKGNDREESLDLARTVYIALHDRDNEGALVVRRPSGNNMCTELEVCVDSVPHPPNMPCRCNVFQETVGWG